MTEQGKRADQYDRDSKIAEIQAHLSWLATDDHFVSQYLDELGPSIRQSMIVLYEQELEAISDLDPNSRDEMIRLVGKPFQDKRDALNPNRSQELDDTTRGPES